jgi:hypothetical protein
VRSHPTQCRYSQTKILFEHHPPHFGAAAFAVRGRGDLCSKCVHRRPDAPSIDYLGQASNAGRPSGYRKSFAKAEWRALLN